MGSKEEVKPDPSATTTETDLNGRHPTPPLTEHDRSEAPVEHPSALNRTNEAKAVSAPAHTGEDLGAVADHITDAWNKMNSWSLTPRDDAPGSSRRESELTAREAELDAKDAAIRGQLHDVERLQEQLAQRERELEAQGAKLAADQATWAEREALLTKKAEELSRREHAVAQRWSRLQSGQVPSPSDSAPPDH